MDLKTETTIVHVMKIIADFIMMAIVLWLAWRVDDFRLMAPGRLRTAVFWYRLTGAALLLSMVTVTFRDGWSLWWLSYTDVLNPPFVSHICFTAFLVVTYYTHRGFLVHERRR